MDVQLICNLEMDYYILYVVYRRDYNKLLVRTKPSDDNHSLSDSTDGSKESGTQKDDSISLEKLTKIFATNFGLNESDGKAVTNVEKVLDELSVDGIVRYMNSGQCEHIVVMVGAGLSTAAGIPDFRSPGSGLYDNLSKYKLPSPECMFDINFFRENPEPFFDLAKQLFPGSFNPTTSHRFLKLLNDKNLLLRLYTQNIDTLERIAGIPGDKLVEAHGTFHTSHCIDCKQQYSLQWMKDTVSPKTPRLLINKTKCGQSSQLAKLLGMGSGLDFDSANAYRDVLLLEDCDKGCEQLAEALGWAQELKQMTAPEGRKEWL
ncbi:unnamed protein product [Medioppia subpectinata]|uniref:Deacetylase sirtuin-type domain-containing protein n=1 Tax=Medioppia subpectinata TaxID=1979941 RepID=A0A7R9Q4J5_9ACAR|nr:unnamed protein product [Medioppia subpectinata]CAG2111497.1 unnamed protein product [Medioppia subpectinata]